MKRVSFFLILTTTLFLSYSCTRATRPIREEAQKNPVVQEIMNEVQEDSNDAAVTNTNLPGSPKPLQTLHVFIENSGSMNGYINRDSEFQMAIGRAIQLMRHVYDDSNIKTYYINQKVREQKCPNNENLYNFVKKMLEVRSFTTSGTYQADRGTTSTNLNEIVKLVLDSVDENNTAILISDFIYSLASTNGETENLLGDCQNLTMYAFLQKTRQLPNSVPLAANLVQLYSKFDGKYWHWEKPTGDGYVRLNCLRPYYMCVLGTDENVRKFNEEIDVTELQGYSNQFTISNKDVSKANYTVMDTKYKKGSYRHNTKPDMPIHAIYRATAGNNNEFGLGIAIDLSDFSMSESDKLDIANYNVETGNYRIDRVEVIDTTKLTNPKDLKLVRDYHCTHVIVVSATGFPNNFSISIKRDLPTWVHLSSSIDDRRIASDQAEQRKTFGLAYFVEGISDAYKYLASNQRNFMTINVTVQSN